MQPARNHEVNHEPEVPGVSNNRGPQEVITAFWVVLTVSRLLGSECAFG